MLFFGGGGTHDDILCIWSTKCSIKKKKKKRISSSCLGVHGGLGCRWKGLSQRHLEGEKDIPGLYVYKSKFEIKEKL